ncbi:MAG: DUF927 domain-containing protein [Kiloniellales bacterium]
MPDAIAAAASTAEAAEPNPNAGPDFRFHRDALQYRRETADGDEWVFLCPKVEVLARTRDGENTNWGRLVSFKDSDGNPHELSLPMEEITKGSQGLVIGMLASHGLDVPTNTGPKGKLLQYLAQAKPDGRYRCVVQVGWSGGTFVLPNETFAPEGADRILYQPEAIGGDHNYRTAGTLREWQQSVAAHCRGNSRLVLAMSLAFAGPLLDLAGAESGGVHLRGASSTGKTTALEVAGSVWGGGGARGFAQPWRATDNALEALAAAHCDTLLCLDELGEAQSKAAGQSAYMLANGQGKQRMTRGAALKRSHRWRILFLSTGEISLADKIAEDGRGGRARAGQEVRVLDVAADAGAGLGLFEDIGDAESASHFAQRLKQSVKANHGEAGRAYLRYLVDHRKQAAVIIQRIQDQLIGANRPHQADGQVERALRRFALIAAAGELARHTNVLPWPDGAASEAVMTCFKAWIDGRGGAEPQEVREGISQVRKFLQEHGASRFQGWDSNDRVLNRAGFFETDGDGQRRFHIMSEIFKSEVTAGFDSVALAKAMVARGFLDPEKSGRSAVSRYVPALGSNARLYQINPSILEGGE